MVQLSGAWSNDQSLHNQCTIFNFNPNDFFSLCFFIPSSKERTSALGVVIYLNSISLLSTHETTGRKNGVVLKEQSLPSGNLNRFAKLKLPQGDFISFTKSFAPSSLVLFLLIVPQFLPGSSSGFQLFQQKQHRHPSFPLPHSCDLGRISDLPNSSNYTC